LITQDQAKITQCPCHVRIVGAVRALRSAAGRVAAELAPLAGLQAGTGRTYIAEELRKITGLTTHRDPAEEDDDQPSG
jgi:hypothetical protein